MMATYDQHDHTQTAFHEQRALRRMIEHAVQMACDHGFVGTVYRLKEALLEIDKELEGTVPRA